MILISCYSVVFAYMFRFDCSCIEMTSLLLNSLVFTIEMKFILSRELKMDLGWIGVFEKETMFASLFIYTGMYGSGWVE